MYEFSFEKFQDAFGPILTCLNTTLYLTFMTFFIGFAIALLLAALSMNKNPAVEAFMKVWLSFFRGTPVLVQLFSLYMDYFPTCPLPGSAAYLACHYMSVPGLFLIYVRNHTGSHSVSRQRQMEACRSIGMSYFQSMRRIILPQAVHYMIPPLSNNFLGVFKGTSLASMVGITEMMLKAKMMSSKDLRFMETYLAVLIIYWGLNIIFSIIQKYIEKYLDKKYA